jgi:ABC-type lipoprotein release transport system permease subunit
VGTLLKLAWRNIWRNKRRTIILLCAMATGLIGIVFCEGFVLGWLDSMIEHATNKTSGQLTIFARGWFQNPGVEKNFALDPSIEAAASGDPRVKAWSPRVRVDGLLNTADRSGMIAILGVDPAREAGVSVVPSAIAEGRWLQSGDENAAVIGAATAKRYNLKLGRKVVLLSQAADGEVGTGAFTVVGLFRTENETFDRSFAYISLPAAQRLVNLPGRATEVSLRLHDLNAADEVAKTLRAAIQSEPCDVLSWEEQQPLTVKMIGMADVQTGIIYVVFFLAMAFGIVNTLLMAVNERYREIGIMLAIGARRAEIVAMVVLESLFLAVIALLIGNAVGLGLVWHFGRAGLDLSAWSKAMEMYGGAGILYLRVGADAVGRVSLATFAIAIVFSLYPAVRASRFKPIEAIQRL